ncbi:MAG: CaiB/BaiF CoA-transferase family protein [Pseudomonadota bacterium]
MNFDTHAVRPLEGVRILDLTRLLPGPFATHYLNELGATVVKIDDPARSDYAKALNPELYRLLNEKKEHMSMALKSGEDHERFFEEVRNADAVVESFRPGVMDAAGLGYDVLRRHNPALVYGALTGYGQTGPYRDRAGHDMNYLGYAGLLDQIGEANGPPVMANLQIADQAGGALAFALGVVAAILRARTSGRGAYVDVGMADASLALLVNATAALNMTGEAPERGRDPLTGGLPNYRIYQCADGRYFALGALEPKFWMGFCNAVERPDLLSMSLSVGLDDDPLRDTLTALFAAQPQAYWTERLAHLDVCATPVLTLDEAFADPHMQARGVFEERDGQHTLRCPIRVADPTEDD